MVIANNNVLSVTEAYLEMCGVNTSNWEQVKGLIYLLGGHPYNIEVTHNAFVRVKDKPYMCRKETLYTTTLRPNRVLKNLQGETEILDVPSNKLAEGTLQLCNELEYAENYQENAKMKQQTQEWIKSLTKKRRKNKGTRSKEHYGYPEYGNTVKG